MFNKNNLRLVSGNGHIVKSVPESKIIVCDWSSEAYREARKENNVILQICNLVDTTLCIEYISKIEYKKYLESWENNE